MRLLLSLTLLMLVPGATAFAFEFEKLFMPGDVITGHEKFEEDCQNCHVRLRDTTQTILCLDCHETIAKDITRKRGFHGKFDKARSNCIACHSDHKGRDASIIRLDKDRFNHDLTNFKLRGKHRQAGCVDCHEAGAKYRNAKRTCVGCHKDEDVHENKLGEKCHQCHSTNSWAEKKFDHDETEFKLSGTHATIGCASCHIENKFKSTLKQCLSCHAIKDVHQKRFGSQCEACHTSEQWDKTSFDHDRDTRYVLEGKHRWLTCKSCHVNRKKGSRIEASLKPRSCYSCHRLDDVHQQTNGKGCGQCHNNNGWLETEFDHDRKTDFALLGAHRKLRCQACHLDEKSDKNIDTSCYSCHRLDDSHNKQEGKHCDDCHNETSWVRGVRFDHDLSDFPLVGQHAAIGCESCHLSSEFKNVKTDCNSCHAAADIHRTALGENCAQCHNPNDWLIWIFDHSKTEFEVGGAHKNLHCHQCHKKPLLAEGSAGDCIDCHRGDDIHNGAFGNNCGRCHKQDEFSSVDMRSMNTFKNQSTSKGITQ